jgi:tryptophanyl-tRNA synthetase
MTMPWDPAQLHARTLETVASLLAVGIDPEASVLFLQSHVPQHTELSWVLTCIARMGELRRMIQFKERSKGESESVGVGLCAYPALQAADVLLYRAHQVPVGEDQRQHIELMRDLAERFNAQFGETLVVPQAYIRKEGARVMALDDPTQKMSKSAGRPAASVLLTDDPATVTKKLKSAKTDSGKEVQASADKPELTNLLTIFSLATGESIADLEARFEGRGYGDFKSELAEAVVAMLEPMRRRYEAAMADPAELERVLAAGAKRAEEVAAAVMSDVRAAVGLRPLQA